MENRNEEFMPVRCQYYVSTIRVLEILIYDKIEDIYYLFNKNVINEYYITILYYLYKVFLGGRCGVLELFSLRCCGVPCFGIVDAMVFLTFD